MIYFVRDTHTGLVKIGYSKAPGIRIRELQIAHAYPLVTMRLLETPRWTEGWFHDLFKTNRIRGEWFVFCDEMMTALPPSALPVKKSSAISTSAITLRLPASLVLAVKLAAIDEGVRFGQWFIEAASEFVEERLRKREVEAANR